jgi:hypothetical protein
VKGVQGDNVTLKMRGNSRGYLIARLKRDGFDDLLAGFLEGKISAFTAAEIAGFRTRRAIRGTGSQNQAKKIAWDVHKVLSSPRPDVKPSSAEKKRPPSLPKRGPEERTHHACAVVTASARVER